MAAIQGVTFISLRASDRAATIREWCLFEGSIYSKKYSIFFDLKSVLISRFQCSNWSVHDLGMRLVPCFMAQSEMCGNLAGHVDLYFCEVAMCNALHCLSH